jgi:hypothetical protein
MTKSRFMDALKKGAPADDRERLRIADEALELAEANLRSLGSDKDDLAYLMEVLRVGVREALYEAGESPSIDTAGAVRTHH